MVSRSRGYRLIGGGVCFALLAGGLFVNDLVEGRERQMVNAENNVGLSQPGALMSHAQAQSRLIAVWPDGNYQLCSQPDRDRQLDGSGVCFNFVKAGNQVDGYYGYPHSDNFVCIRGRVGGDRIMGKALVIAWEGNPWEHIPTVPFTWDPDGRLTLNQGRIIQRSNDAAGKTDWILFSDATLNVDGFYQYDRPRMNSPIDLCHWPQALELP